MNQHAATFRVLILILLILGDLESVTVVNHHPDEEYYLEHEVLHEEAINEAKKLHLYPGNLNVLKRAITSRILKVFVTQVLFDFILTSSGL